jgi:leader peptidase (prepilin peptidase)/N-methyltransferase
MSFSVVSFIVASAAVLGALVGSFLNVVVWRVPRRESVVTPASHCPNCDSPIRRRDNVPVVSWLLLRAKCRDCGARISARYPLVELGTGLCFAAVTWWATAERADPRTSAEAASTGLVLVAFLYLAAVSIALALIDLDTHSLPNRIVYPALIVSGVLLGAASLVSGDYLAAARAAIAGVALFAAYLALALAYPGGMGYGDVKLAAVLGVYLGFLGWPEFAVGAFAPFLVGGIFSIGLVLAKRAGRKSRIPFGPWMLVGAWVGIFLGAPIASWYLGFVGLAE